MQNQTLSREDLYEKVWSTPMSKLAQEFGISDVGLKKLCRRNGIPTPGLGHWRLLETGHPSPRAPLPSAKGSKGGAITITAHAPKPYEIVGVRQPAPEIEIDEDRDITHPFAVRTKRILRHATKDSRGLLVPKGDSLGHLSITASALPRALRILDGLFYAIEKQGYELRWPNQANSALLIVAEPLSMSFHLSETVGRRAHVLSKQEAGRRKVSPYGYAPQWDYFATGHLRLSIDSVPYGMTAIRRSWGDTKTQNVETCLGEFVITLPRVAAAIKFNQEERERQHQRRLEEEKRAEAERKRRTEYDRKAELVARLGQSLHEAGLMREFAAALKQAARSPAVPIEQKVGVLRVVDWIERHANGLDPLTDVAEVIRQFDNRPA